MKLKQLIIENIASIEKATIDFEAEPLAGADVFLIAGKIGAGKSTILDCICLALYGQTPRLPEVKRSKNNETVDEWTYSDQRRIVRMGAPGGSTTLIFEAYGHILKARWFASAYVNGAKKGQVKDAFWKVKNLSTGDLYTKKKEVENYLMQVIGLDFSQFCRTTMLAQGEFSRFLKSTHQEKADILLKITGVDIYKRIGRAISEAATSARIERDAIQTKLNAQIAMTDEERCLVASQLAACNALASAYRELADTSRTNLQWLKVETELSEKVNKATTDYDNALAESKTDDVVYNSRLLDVYARTTTLRAQLSELKNCEATIKKCDATAETLNIKDADIAQRLSELGSDFSLADTRKLHDELKDKLTALEDARNKCRISELDEKNATENALTISTSEATIAKNKSLIEQGEKDLSKLEGSVEACQEAVESLRLATGDEAEQLRADLTVGCKCPVCLQQVADLPSSTGLHDEYKKSKQRLADARKNHTQKQGEVNALKLESKQAEKKLNESTAKKSNLEAQALKSKGEADEACRKAGCTRDTLSNLVAKCPQIKEDINTLKNNIKKGEDIEKDRNDLNVKQAANEATLGDARRNSQRLNDLIAKERTHNPDISDIELKDTVAKTDKEIERVRVTIEKIDRELQRAQTALQTARSNHAANASKRPTTLDDNISIEQLTQHVSSRQQKVETLTQESGRLSQRLEADASTRRERIKLNAALKLADKKNDLHQRLNNLIGDKDGKNFSRIALSYVLGSLIENANVYLRRLTDRYTLRVEPGTYVIMVCDSWQDYTERTVNTTSGGETFLISLALALALSDIGNVRGMNTLFIDEGFGSLSEEDARHAIDALAGMHKVSGRQVGIISHVAALRERIPVQICVDGGANRASNITIKG